MNPLTNQTLDHRTQREDIQKGIANLVECKVEQMCLE